MRGVITSLLPIAVSLTMFPAESRNADSLLLQTPEGFWSRFRVEVRLGNEVLAIDTQQKRLQVKNLKTGEEYAESYDYLILSPGAYPFVPPIEGRRCADVHESSATFPTWMP